MSGKCTHLAQKLALLQTQVTVLRNKKTNSLQIQKNTHEVHNYLLQQIFNQDSTYAYHQNCLVNMKAGNLY